MVKQTINLFLIKIQRCIKLTYYQQNHNNAKQKDVPVSKVIYFSGDELEEDLLNTISLEKV